jgi:hypothetical protein
VVQGGAIDPRDFGDGRLGDVQGQQARNFLLFSIQLGPATYPPWSAQPLPSGSRRGECFSGPQRNQLPLDVRKQAEHRHHDARVQILYAIEPNALLNREQLDPLLHEGIDRRDDFANGTAETTSFTHDQDVPWS